MKYVYILDENNIVTEIFNAYEDDDIENVINGRTHIIKDEKLNVINYKYQNGKFENIALNNTSKLSDVQIMLSQIMLDMQKIKSKLGGELYE